MLENQGKIRICLIIFFNPHSRISNIIVTNNWQFDFHRHCLVIFNFSSKTSYTGIIQGFQAQIL